MQNSETLEAIRVLNRLVAAVADNTKHATNKTEREEQAAAKEALALLLGRKPSKIEVDWSRSESWGVIPQLRSR